MDSAEKIIELIQSKHLTTEESLALIKKNVSKLRAEKNENNSQNALQSRESFQHGELYLKDHIVFDKQVVMGVTFCSLILDLADKYFPEVDSFRIKNILFKIMPSSPISRGLRCNPITLLSEYVYRL